MARTSYNITAGQPVGEQSSVLSEAQANGDLKTGTDLLTRSKDIAAMVPYWDLTDTIIDGISALRQSGKKYLPKFDSEDDSTYDMRLSLTKFTNVYRDIIEGLSAKPFEEEVSLIDEDGANVPDVLTDLIEDVDGAGTNLTEFASETFFNGLNSAVHWVFVDFPSSDELANRPKTLEQFKKQGLRPYWSQVLARNVIAVKTKVIAGKSVLTYMRILEPDTDNGDGDTADHIRILERDNETGVINWELWKKIHHDSNLGQQKWIKVGFGTLSIGVIPLTPFATGRREGRTFKFLPPLQDAADLSLELYLQESGLKYAKTISAYSMLVGEGVKPEKEGGKTKKLEIGPMRVLYAPPNAQGQNGTWKFIQGDPAVMTFLKADITETIQNLRELGRQPLTAQSGNLTTITTAIASGKARSAVGAWALGLKNTLENAFLLTMLWVNISPDAYDPEVFVYTEFDDVLDDGKDLAALEAARAGGDLSQETYWSELKRRKVLSPEFDAKKERKALMDESNSDEGETGEDDPPPPDDEPVIPPGSEAE